VNKIRLTAEHLEDRSTPATFTVTNNLDDGSTGSLVWAISQAAANSDSGNTIVFSPSVTDIVFSNTLTITNNKPLTIDGGTGVTLDGNDTIEVMSVGDNANVTLKNMTIQGGYTTGDGAGIGSAGRLVIDKCTFTNNTAGNEWAGGGGIFIDQGSATISNSTFTNNSDTNGGGGGIGIYSGTLNITNCTISNNSGGGGIYNRVGSITISGTTISGNSSSASGGGIDCPYANSSLSITDSTITHNTAHGSGGGIDANNGSITLTDCTISDNTANAGDGGGIATPTMTITNCLINGNTASGNGGGIDCPNLTITGATVSNNTAAGSGGGVYSIDILNGADLTMKNCTINNNQATSGSGGGVYGYDITTISNSTIYDNTTLAGNGGGIYITVEYDIVYGILADSTTIITNSTVSGNSLVSGTSSGSGIYGYTGLTSVPNANTIDMINTIVSNGVDGDLAGGAGYKGSNDLIGDGQNTSGLTNTISGDPKLAPLGNYGGPTETLALLPNSQAINAGTTAGATSTDERGVARDSQPDIGAYEYQALHTQITGKPSNPSNSNALSFTFASTGGSGAAVTFDYQLDGGSWTPTTSPLNLSGLSDGSHTIAVAALDPVDGIDANPATYTWVIDTTPPTVSITSEPNNPTNIATASFTYNGTDTGTGVDHYEYRIDGGTWTTDTTGATSFTGLADGSHTFQVEAVDKAGNISTAASYAWTLDTTPPMVSITSEPNNPTNIATASFTFSGTDSVSGVDHYEYRIDGGAWTSNTTGAASFTGLADGSHTFAVEAVDKAGNISTAASYTWTLDTTPPTVTITSEPNNPGNTTSFTYSGTDTGTGVDHYEYRVDGGAWTSNTTGVASFAGLSDGSHTFAVEAVDKAGNISTAASYTWTLDTTPPTVTITAKPSNLTTIATASFTFSGTDSGTGVDHYEYRIDGGAWTSNTTGAASFTGLADGSHTFAVEAVDKAGNISTASYTWTLDTTPPTVSITSEPSNQTTRTSASFTFSGTDAVSGVAYYEYRIDGGVWTGNTTGAATFTGLSVGSHTFEVEAVDRAGNVSTAASYTWTINTTLERIAVGSGEGAPSLISVYDTSGNLLTTINPFDGYQGGIKVAVGDVTGDGVADIIVGAGPGAPGGHIKIYDGVTFQEIASFFAYPGFEGGVSVAAGDVAGNGVADIIIGTTNDNDHVEVRTMAGGEVMSFYAFGVNNPVGVTIAAGDVEADGRSDVVVGSATGMGQVEVFQALTGAMIQSYTPFAGYTGGIFVAAGDVNGDGHADIIVGSATGDSHVAVFDGVSTAEILSFIAYPGAGVGVGVHVGAVDLLGNGVDDILTGPAGTAPHVKAYNGSGATDLSFISEAPGQPTSQFGIYIAGGTGK